MIEYEKILLENPPDLVIVVGDVNSTAAVTMAAVKLGIKVAHLEGHFKKGSIPLMNLKMILVFYAQLS